MLQPAVKKETIRIAAFTGAGTILMFIVFLLLHLVFPAKIPFGWHELLSGVIGFAVAVLNFLLMGLMVQAVTGLDDADAAKKRVKSSYNRRMILQAGWVVIAFLAPCFNGAAALIPLLLPGLWLKLYGAVTGMKKTSEIPANAENEVKAESDDTATYQTDAVNEPDADIDPEQS